MGSEYIPPVRLAILEADTPVPGVKAKFGSYGGVFKYLFERACASLNPPQPLSSLLEISSHDVVNDLDSYPDPKTIDAILISGSKHSAYEDDEWIVRLVEYTQQCLESGRVRVIGICFGHQIVGRAMGAEVGKNVLGWELSVTEHELTNEGKKLFGVEKLVRLPFLSLSFIFIACPRFCYPLPSSCIGIILTRIPRIGYSPDAP